MIAGVLHVGSGLGNQLFRYITTRVIADEKGYDFGMVNPEAFKGASFMNIDMGKPVPGNYVVEVGTGRAFTDIDGYSLYEEKKVIENGVDIRSYDPEINFIGDNTIIDGEFQDDKYWGHRLYDIGKWLQVAPLEMPADTCVIGFRGGEFYTDPDLGLPTSYYEEAIDRMLRKNYHMKFVCVTDDPITARAMLPDFVKITHDVGEDWRKVRFAKNLIISNSSFYILPALLNRGAGEVIAPRYWARRNTGQWALQSNYYRKFSYI